MLVRRTNNKALNVLTGMMKRSHIHESVPIARKEAVCVQLYQGMCQVIPYQVMENDPAPTTIGGVLNDNKHCLEVDDVEQALNEIVSSLECYFEIELDACEAYEVKKLVEQVKLKPRR